MSSQHKLYTCSDSDCRNLTTATWCKPCGYKYRKNIPWNKGISCPDDVRHKISKSKKGIKNPKHSEWLKSNPNLYWLGKKRPDLSGEKNPQWKGDKAGYTALHIWVRKYLGQPRTCEHCGKSGLTSRKIHWANKSHQYLRDLNDWVRLCVPCHREYDKNA